MHGVGGMLGLLLTAVLAASLDGLGLETSMGAQFMTQLIGVVATTVWCAVLSFIILKFVDKTIGLRVNADEETEGLDLALHNERGYSL